MASFSASLAFSWRSFAHLAPLHPFSALASVWRPRVHLVPSRPPVVLFCFFVEQDTQEGTDTVPLHKLQCIVPPLVFGSVPVPGKVPAVLNVVKYSVRLPITACTTCYGYRIILEHQYRTFLENEGMAL
jgi:hypothetical protein